jgi:glucose/mannose-6-phosphate isomerase
MIDVTDRKQLGKIDKNGAIDSIEQLPQQMIQAWKEVSAIKLPASYKNFSNVFVCGMGASWLGTHIIQGLMIDRLRIPVLVGHDYVLPGYVGKDTLLIASSYSGTTEETVEAMKKGYEKGAKVITVSTGGTLAKFAREKELPNYTFNPTHNPAKSPRLGLGYSVIAQMSFLAKAGVLDIDENEILDSISYLQHRVNELRPEAKNNEAQVMAFSLEGYIPIIIAGTFLWGSAHAFSNMINETSKKFATYLQIPELNHHNMEGLAHPPEIRKLKYVFLSSSLYDERVQKRILVTQDVVMRNNVGHLTYAVGGKTKLVQAFDALLFASFVSYYLAMMYGMDPSSNPWVDYFKLELAKI